MGIRAASQIRMKPSIGKNLSGSSSESDPLDVSTVKFEALYRQHGPAVYRYAFSITRRRELAEDLTSEAFLALHREIARIDQGQLPAWLITVVRNRARDYWRRRVVEERYLESEIRSAEPSVEAPPLEGWILQCADLKPVHRTCLMLRFVAGMSRTEIAAETGLSETQVKSYLQYALALLRKAHGVGEP
jgi:RNA polymerase sigma-70 factor (ECF subfamily)